MKLSHEEDDTSLNGGLHYTLIGVVSGGIGECRNEDLPAVYIRMEDKDVLGFIRAAIGGLYPRVYPSKKLRPIF